METTSALYFKIYKFPSASSAIPANLHHHSRLRRLPNFSMLLRDLTIQRITASQYYFREAFCTTAINHHKMAHESKNMYVAPGKVDPTTSNIGQSKEARDKASEKSTPAILPPPEKPLPGDCCSSGCVRCVWDVYYEELEEYNRLYNAHDSKIS